MDTFWVDLANSLYQMHSSQDIKVTFHAQMKQGILQGKKEHLLIPDFLGVYIMAPWQPKKSTNTALTPEKLK